MKVDRCNQVTPTSSDHGDSTTMSGNDNSEQFLDDNNGDDNGNDEGKENIGISETNDDESLSKNTQQQQEAKETHLGATEILVNFSAQEPTVQTQTQPQTPVAHQRDLPPRSSK